MNGLEIFNSYSYFGSQLLLILIDTVVIKNCFCMIHYNIYTFIIMLYNYKEIFHTYSYFGSQLLLILIDTLVIKNCFCMIHYNIYTFIIMLYNYTQIFPQQFYQYHTVLYHLHLACNSHKANYKLVLVKTSPM